MQKGKIIRIISNHYTIENEQGQVIAQPRGKMRQSIKPVVGDMVLFETGDDYARIHEVINRKNRLLRPSVANVDQAFIVTSAKDPDYSEHLLNRLIFLVSLAEVDPVVCLTKSDLLTADEQIKMNQEMDWYRKAGYKVLISHPGSNDDEILEALKGKVTVLCGQSGAGKSSLLNRLDPKFHLITQETSKALGRGKHTTRHCELHHVGQGLVADTPGFSSLEFSNLDIDHLDQAILDFSPYIGHCRYANCKHINEPDCAIKAALESKKLNPSVYEDYKQIIKEKQDGPKKYGPKRSKRL